MQREELTTIASPETTGAFFVLNTGFDAALARVRQAIQGAGLTIVAEIDSARRAKRALQLQVPPCRLLLVDNPLFMLQTATINRAAGVFLPLHVVISGAGSRTMVYLLSLAYIQQPEMPIGVRAPLVELRGELFRALSGIADAAYQPGDGSGGHLRQAFTLG